MNREGKRALEKELERIRPFTEEIIAAALQIHKETGPGLAAEAYRDALAQELGLRNLRVELHEPFVFVEDSVVVRVESVDRITDGHEAELLRCLRAARHRVGLLFNFNAGHLAEGLRRITDEL